MVRSGNYRKINLIPCGKCIECRLNDARDKATQLMLEKLDPKYGENECWFLTLTYDDLHIRTHTTMNMETGEKFEGTSIQECDMQNFWKRCRKNLKLDHLKYLNVMEYGGQTGRPHAHAVVFGLPLDIAQFKKIGNNSQGDALWTSKQLEDLWKLGQVTIGEVTFQSISYVARYTLKKTKAQYDDWWYMSQGKSKEWKSSSQGLGRWYYENHKDEIYKRDCVPILDNNGNPQKPPKCYDRWYKAENPEKFDSISKKRERQAISALRDQERHTDIKGRKYLQAKEKRIMDSFKDLRGDANGIQI